jgi:methionine synthase II (cobalamin-independent)
MAERFQPNGCATLIGSQPVEDHHVACELILEYTPDLPTWPQLPVYPHEGMVSQFMPGMPGLIQDHQRYFVDTLRDDFESQVLTFFESYLAYQDSDSLTQAPPLGLTADEAKGFFSMQAALRQASSSPLAVKGQVTGPITFATALKDQDGRSIFYNDTLREAAVKLLAMKAAWQVFQFKEHGCPVIVFLDEPSLASFGSSEFISISKEEIDTCIQEVVDAVHNLNGLTGVHVCANTDWSLLLESDVDIINFDAYGYFDKFVLYADQIKAYLESGRMLAWGLVPTLDVDALNSATDEQLWQDWVDKSRRVADLGIGLETVYRQALITPSCGCGSLTPELSRRAMKLTRNLSQRVRGEFAGQ